MWWSAFDACDFFSIFNFKKFNFVDRGLEIIFFKQNTFVRTWNAPPLVTSMAKTCADKNRGLRILDNEHRRRGCVKSIRLLLHFILFHVWFITTPIEREREHKTEIQTCTGNGVAVPGRGCNSPRTLDPVGRILSCRRRLCTGCRRTTVCSAGVQRRTTTARTMTIRTSGGGCPNGGADGARPESRLQTRSLWPLKWSPGWTRVPSSFCRILTSETTRNAQTLVEEKYWVFFSKKKKIYIISKKIHALEEKKYVGFLRVNRTDTPGFAANWRVRRSRQHYNI